MIQCTCFFRIHYQEHHQKINPILMLRRKRFMKWYEENLEHIINQIYNEKSDKDLIKDFLVAYEYESGDKSLRGVDDGGLFLSAILFNSKVCLLPGSLSNCKLKSYFSTYSTSLNRECKISNSNSICSSISRSKKILSYLSYSKSFYIKMYHSQSKSKNIL